MNLGRTIKLCRNARGLTQEQLAQKAGLSLSYLSLIENDRRDPAMSTVRSISDALQVPLSIIMFLAADKDELSGFNQDVRDKLSSVALALIQG